MARGIEVRREVTATTAAELLQTSVVQQPHTRSRRGAAPELDRMPSSNDQVIASVRHPSIVWLGCYFSCTENISGPAASAQDTLTAEVVFNFPLAPKSRAAAGALAGPMAQSHAAEMRRIYQAAPCKFGCVLQTEAGSSPLYLMTHR